MPRGMEVGLDPSDIVLDGDPATPPQKGDWAPPKKNKKNLAHVYCGQTDGWIKMQLCTKVGFSPGHIVLHGDPAPPSQKGHSPPIFGPSLLWPNSRSSQLLLSTCSRITWVSWHQKG